MRVHHGRAPSLQTAVALSELELHLIAERDPVLHRQLVERARDGSLHTCAVVAPDPHDQGVVELAQLLDRIDHAPDVVVGVLGISGEDLHLPGIERLQLVGESVHAGNASSRGVSSASSGITPSCFCRTNVSSRSASQPWSNLPLYSVGPLLRDVVRRMAAPGRVVDEERLRGILCPNTVEPVDGLVVIASGK